MRASLQQQTGKFGMTVSARKDEWCALELVSCVDSALVVKQEHSHVVVSTSSCNAYWWHAIDTNTSAFSCSTFDEESDSRYVVVLTSISDGSLSVTFLSDM